MIATGGFLHILLSSFMLASRPINHAIMVLVSTINLFVGFTGACDPIESVGNDDFPTDHQIWLATHVILGDDSHEDAEALVDDPNLWRRLHRRNLPR
jgi:hypothetical protein